MFSWLTDWWVCIVKTGWLTDGDVPVALIDKTDWLTDWLINWLIEWLIDWLLDWLIDGWIAWLTDLSNAGYVNTCCLGWLTDWKTDVDWLIDVLTDWLIDWVIVMYLLPRLTDWLIDRLMDWLSDGDALLLGLIDWLTDRLVDWLIVIYLLPGLTGLLTDWWLHYLIWLIDWLIEGYVHFAWVSPEYAGGLTDVLIYLWVCTCCLGFPRVCWWLIDWLIDGYVPVAWVSPEYAGDGFDVSPIPQPVLVLVVPNLQRFERLNKRKYPGMYKNLLPPPSPIPVGR